MWVKICGNTNLEDALVAAELGADAVGFVFAPGKRQVQPEFVGRIVGRLPGSIEVVGVFPAWGAERIEAAVQASGVTTIQLHGGYDAALTEELEVRLGGRVGIIQVMHWEVGQEVSNALPLAERVLVDSKVGGATGGTGVPFPWEAARALFDNESRMILAGGLRQENLAVAIDTLRPWGVDVASGVESVPGKKDRARLEGFFAAIRSTSG